MFATLLFGLFSALAVGSGLVVVTQRNPFNSAIALVMTFFFLAVDYVLLSAPFLAAIQILLYAGAIMVLFLFVIMLLNLRDEKGLGLRPSLVRAIPGAMATLLVGGVLLMVITMETAELAPSQAPGDLFGTTAAIGFQIFNGGYLLPLEAASILLTVALVGAIVLSKREI